MTDIIQQQWSTLAAHKQAEFYKAGSNLLTKFIKCMPVFITRNFVTLLLVHLLYRLYVCMYVSSSPGWQQEECALLTGTNLAEQSEFLQTEAH